MDSFKIYSQSDILNLVNKRPGENKLGEKVGIYPSETLSIADLRLCPAQFVLLGIPEDIGVRANHGIGGAHTAWSASLSALLNIQSNPFLDGEELLVLGHFDISEPSEQQLSGLREKVGKIDLLVYPVIEKIVAAGKIPIVIGGGHNNAAPIIWGAALALQHAINVVNIDAHADLRNTTEGRHSGNGFSYALQHNFLNQYRIFGLHQNYSNSLLPHYIQTHQKLKAFYFEDLLKDHKSFYENWIDFTWDLPEPCGLEIDLDSVQDCLSSAVSPSGFALNDIRKILLAGKQFTYLHLCEGAVELADGRTDATVGKAIAYLITDFIKALLPRTYPQP